MSRPSTPGLFSSVLGYITREVSDFVVTAAGGEPSKAQAQATANLNAVKDGKSERKKERKRRRVQSEVQGEGEEAHETVQKQRKRRSHDEPEQRAEKAEGSQKSSRRRLSPPSPESSRAGPSNAPEPSTSKDAEPGPAPRRRKRRSSVTMPGSFDLRSASLEPESPSEPEPESHPAPEPSTSRYVDYQIPLPPSRPSTPPSASRTSRSPQSWTPPSPRGKRVGAATRRFSNDGDPALMLPKHPHSPNHREEKGKGKALPAVFDSSSDEESSEEDNGRASPSPRAKKNENRLGNALKRTMSVGGIERELNAVRQAHAEKEAAWEGADTTVVHDEREDFLEKIHGLEAEVMRLKAELAKASNSSVPMPPPPPPPPPPLYFRARIPTTPAPDALYAATRAQLRHAATPNEAPINPLRNSKIGKATVQLSGDKMAAFLTEVRNVRLRKVQQAPKDLEKSRDFARGENLGSGLGKRKRVQEGEGEEGEDGDGEVVRRLKRRFTMAGEGAKAAFNKSRMDLDPFSRSFAFGSAPSGSSASGSASSSSGSSYASGSRAGFARVPSSVDGTDVTPSLASDNDAESLLLFEDRAVRTPPPPMDSAPAIAIRTPAPRQEDAILAEENHEVDEEVDVDPSPFRRTFPKTPLPSNARHSTSPSDSDSASPPMQISELFDPPMSEKARGKQRASDANQAGNGGTAPGSVFTKRKPSAPLDRPTPPRARPPRRVPRASSPPPNASFDFSRREEEEESSDVDEAGFGSHARASTNSSMAASTTSRGSILSASTAAREEIVSKSRTARSLIPKRVYGGGNGRVKEVVDEGEDGVERVEMVRPPTPPRAHQPPSSRLPAPAVKKAGLVSKGRPQTQLPVKKAQQPKAQSKTAPQSKPAKPPAPAPTQFAQPQDELELRRQRRQTLEQELLEAASRVSESRLLDLDLDAEMEVFQSPAGGHGDEDVFEGKGMRGGKAFMAHGGAGGRPVRMGRGYVRGASLDDDE